jgi:hypothetical protein
VSTLKASSLRTRHSVPAASFIALKSSLLAARSKSLMLLLYDRRLHIHQLKQWLDSGNLGNTFLARLQVPGASV